MNTNSPYVRSEIDAYKKKNEEEPMSFRPQPPTFSPSPAEHASRVGTYFNNSRGSHGLDDSKRPGYLSNPRGSQGLDESKRPGTIHH
jgi:hypothetical protein